VSRLKSRHDLVAIAEDILSDYLYDNDIEYSTVYESERAAGLTEDDQLEVHRLVNSASISFVIGNKEDK